jgi:hypothetical protein
MKLIFNKFDDYYICYAHMYEPSNELIEYLKEIHMMFIGGKRSYVFLKGHCYVMVDENYSAEREIEIAGEFSKLKYPTQATKTHSSFRFDINDESFEIEARLNVQTADNFIPRLNAALELYSMRSYFTPFDVIKM